MCAMSDKSGHYDDSVFHAHIVSKTLSRSKKSLTVMTKKMHSYPKGSCVVWDIKEVVT